MSAQYFWTLVDQLGGTYTPKVYAKGYVLLKGTVYLTDRVSKCMQCVLTFLPRHTGWGRGLITFLGLDLGRRNHQGRNFHFCFSTVWASYSTPQLRIHPRRTSNSLSLHWNMFIQVLPYWNRRPLKFEFAIDGKTPWTHWCFWRPIYMNYHMVHSHDSILKDKKTPSLTHTALSNRTFQDNLPSGYLT
jgi:hypothetical protein